MKKGFLALLVFFAMLAGQMYSLPEAGAVPHVDSHDIESADDQGCTVYKFPDGTKLTKEKVKIYNDIDDIRSRGYMGSSQGMADDTAFFVYDKQSNKFCYKEKEDIQSMMDWSSTVLVKADVWRTTNPLEQQYYGGVIASEYVVKVLDKQGNLHDYRLILEKIDPLRRRTDGCDFFPWAIAEYIPGSTELDPGRTALPYPSVTLAKHENPEWPIRITPKDPSEPDDVTYDKVENVKLTSGEIETINHALNDYVVDW